MYLIKSKIIFVYNFAQALASASPRGVLQKMRLQLVCVTCAIPYISRLTGHHKYSKSQMHNQKIQIQIQIQLSKINLQGLDLHSCLTQILKIFPHLQANEFYVTGESYAGKYVPAIAHRIHMANQEGDTMKINLKGLAIGDGLCDPVSMTGYGNLLHGVGLINSVQKAQFEVLESQARKFIKEEAWVEAFNVFDALLNGDLTGLPSLFTNATGFHYYFNYLNTEEPKDMGYYPAFLELATTRRALHVGNLTYNSGEEVERHLLKDIMQSTKPWIEELMTAGYKVLIYNGQLDVIIGHSLTQAFVDSLQWPARRDFDRAPRTQWHVGPDLAGYSKTAGSFTQLLVRNAGHMVPYDQPKWSFDLINRFTSGKPFV